MRILLCYILLSASLAFGAVPTGQPTGVPSSRPTTFPTTNYQSRISTNVTFLLHEVDSALFNTQYSKCIHAVGISITQILGLEAEQGFRVYGTTATPYANEIFDYNFLGDFPNDKDPTIVSSRRLGASHGSYGSTLYMSLTASPPRMRLSETDAYFQIMNDLKDMVASHVVTSYMRDQAIMSSCTSLASLSGITLSYISNEYTKTIDRMASPTSYPTTTRAHYRNRDGVIAGLIVGITAFIVAAMILSKYQTLELLGMKAAEPNVLQTDRRLDCNYALVSQTSQQNPEVELADGDHAN